MKKVKLLLISTILLLTACTDKEKGKLDNRVKDYWTAKINQDFKTAYQFLSPGWKQNESQESFTMRMKASRVKWLTVKLEKKECVQIDLCKVYVNIGYEYKFGGAISNTISIESIVKENWILKENVWYNVPEK